MFFQSSILVLLICFVVFLPIIFVFNKKVKHKKLFIYFILLTNLKPVFTLTFPLLFIENIFDKSIVYYYYLLTLYFIFISLIYLLILTILNSKYFYIISKTKSNGLTIMSTLLGIMCFLILVYNSNGVFLIDPRLGYQVHRDGVGFIWVFYIVFIGMAFYFSNILKSTKIKKSILFVFLFYLTGSKQLVLDVFLKTFYLFNFKKIKLKKLSTCIILIFLSVVMLKMFDQFSASQSFLVRLSKYFTTVELATLVFDDYENQTLPQTSGSIALSSFWSYVPRLLFPDKPYDYGTVWLVEYYFPGMAERGHTPAFGLLTHEFVDFRWFAPFAAIILNPAIILKILLLLIVVTNATVSKNLKTLALCYVFVPGFGFHLPLPFTILLGYFIIPNLTRSVKVPKLRI